MKPVVPKPQRCAIYTRKSTEHNLDLEFNSLDAQREACETTADSREPPSIALPCKTSWLMLGLARLPLWWSIRSTASRFMSRDRYRLPLLVRARQRGLKCIAICFAWGCSSDFARSPPPGRPTTLRRRADPWLVTGPITGESFPICPTSKEEFAEYKTNRVNKLELELRTMRYRGGEATNVLMAWILSVH
jgi:hypothetical protein